MSLAETRASDQAADIARRFVEARLRARAVDGYPGAVPANMADAYLIQDAAIGQFPGAIIGWKVGGVPSALQPSLGVHRIAGPIFDRNLWRADGAQVVDLPAIADGFAAVEAEFIARIGQADPSRLDWTVDAARDVVDAVFVGVELAGSPLSEINDLGSAVVASDFGNNGGLVVGPELSDWRDRLDGIEVETRINGAGVGAGRAASLSGGPMESVRFLLEHCARRGRPLRAGDLVSTGAITGVHRVDARDAAVCIFGDFAEIHCSVVKAEPNGN